MNKHDKWAKTVGKKGHTEGCKSEFTEEEHRESYSSRGAGECGCQGLCTVITTDKNHQKTPQKQKHSDGMKEWKHKQS